jgi:sialic acid synthase SpsE
MKKKIEFSINKKKIGLDYPTYFIADIAANHDGNFQKAVDLINKAKESGADAAKFQHFTADTIVSKKTFDEMRTKLSHQKNWKKSVHQVYDEASLKLEWTEKLKKECDKIDIDFFTAPYSIKLINFVNKYVCAYKVGSGEITWIDSLIAMAKKNKPIIIATGASELVDVKRAVKNIKKYNSKICVMQCNTNYTADVKNLKFINLNVLKKYKTIFPYAVLGLSDHTHGHSTVLGAITLGARMIEKHFTLSNKFEGPDHKFSMNSKTWSEMIKRSKELENSLGTGIKRIEENETESFMVQRRSIHFNKKLKKNSKIYEKDLIYLRPYLTNSLHPFEKNKIIGKKVNKDFEKGEIIFWKNLK